jgi:hypothetical protein
MRFKDRPPEPPHMIGIIICDKCKQPGGTMINTFGSWTHQGKCPGMTWEQRKQILEHAGGKGQ